MREAVIVSAVRTPTGRFLGSLKDFSASDLGAMVVREAVRRAGIDPKLVDECIMGNVVSAGVGQAPDGFSAAPFLRHADARVRREAFRAAFRTLSRNLGSEPV